MKCLILVNFNLLKGFWDIEFSEVEIKIFESLYFSVFEFWLLYLDRKIGLIVYWFLFFLLKEWIMWKFYKNLLY